MTAAMSVGSEPMASLNSVTRYVYYNLLTRRTSQLPFRPPCEDNNEMSGVGKTVRWSRT